MYRFRVEKFTALGFRGEGMKGKPLSALSNCSFCHAVRKANAANSDAAEEEVGII